MTFLMGMAEGGRDYVVLDVASTSHCPYSYFLIRVK